VAQRTAETEQRTGQLDHAGIGFVLEIQVHGRNAVPVAASELKELLPLIGEIDRQAFTDLEHSATSILVVNKFDHAYLLPFFLLCLEVEPARPPRPLLAEGQADQASETLGQLLAALHIGKLKQGNHDMLAAGAAAVVAPIRQVVHRQFGVRAGSLNGDGSLDESIPDLNTAGLLQTLITFHR